MNNINNDNHKIQNDKLINNQNLKNSFSSNSFQDPNVELNHYIEKNDVSMNDITSMNEHVYNNIHLNSNLIQDEEKSLVIQENNKLNIDSIYTHMQTINPKMYELKNIFPYQLSQVGGKHKAMICILNDGFIVCYYIRKNSYIKIFSRISQNYQSLNNNLNLSLNSQSIPIQSNFQFVKDSFDENFNYDIKKSYYSEQIFLICMDGRELNDNAVYCFSNGIIQVNILNENYESKINESLYYTNSYHNSNQNNDFQKKYIWNSFGDQLKQLDTSKICNVIWYNSEIFFVAFESGYLYAYFTKWNEDISGIIEQYNSLSTKDLTFENLFNKPNLHHIKNKLECNPFICIAIGNNIKVNDISISLDRKYMALACSDGFLRIYDINDENYRLYAVFRSYFGEVKTCCWSPQGKYIISGGEDDLISVYNLKELKLICIGKGHRNFVSKVKVIDSYDDDKEIRIVSCGRDCNLIIWDLDLSKIELILKNNTNNSKSNKSNEQNEFNPSNLFNPTKEKNETKYPIFYPESIKKTISFGPKYYFTQNFPISDFIHMNNVVITINDEGQLFRIPIDAL